VTRAWAVSAVALGVACHGRSSAALQQFDSAQAMRWVEYQVAAGPRVPGTPGHRAIAEWLERELKARADSVEVQAFTHVAVTGDTLLLRNIIARFRPSDPNRVLYVTHWDTRPIAESDPDPAKRSQPIPGANDGASGTALLLAVADALKKSPPAVGVDLLFVDGEDYGAFDSAGADVLIGSRYFAAHLPAGYRPLFGVLWDMVGGRNQQIYQEGYSLERAPEVVERVWSAAEELHLGGMFRPINGGYITDDHVPLLRAGIRAIDVIGFENYKAWHHTTQDTPDKMSAATLADVGRLALSLLH
jgi:Zn-dependent M28 family amino/carboxypeptidase